MGQKLRLLREEKNLTQKQVSERVGLAISAISSYESGNRYPSYEVLIKLASIYHVSADYLLGLEERKTIEVSGLDDKELAYVAQLVELFRNGKK